MSVRVSTVVRACASSRRTRRCRTSVDVQVVRTPSYRVQRRVSPHGGVDRRRLTASFVDPCSRNPCGQGVCEVVPSLVHGYLCRCAGDAISLTSCNGTTRPTARGRLPSHVLFSDSKWLLFQSVHQRSMHRRLDQFLLQLSTDVDGQALQRYVNVLSFVPVRNARDERVERMPSPCASNPCHPGRCFQLNDPAVPMVCYCQNEQFGLSCRGTSICWTARRMHRLPLLGSEYFSSTSRMLTMSSITTTSTTTSTTSMASTTTTARPPYACNPFDSRTCMNDGRCLATTQNFRCLCQAGFTGTFCEISK